MNRRHIVIWFIGLSLALAACSAAAPSAESGGGETPFPEATAPPTSEPTESSELPTPVATAPLDTGKPQPAITEERFVEIEWPVSIRLGDSDFVRLSLVPGEAGSLVPTAESEGHETTGEPIEIPDVYDTHNVLAIAELSGIGFEVDRPGEISEPLLPGERAVWQWTIAPKSAGEHVVTLSLRLQFVPKAGGGSSERAVWARTLHIEGRTVLGLSGRLADLLGVAGTVFGSVLGFPFADKVYGWVWRRLFPKTRKVKRRDAKTQRSQRG